MAHYNSPHNVQIKCLKYLFISLLQKVKRMKCALMSSFINSPRYSTIKTTQRACSEDSRDHRIRQRALFALIDESQRFVFDAML